MVAFVVPYRIVVEVEVVKLVPSAVALVAFAASVVLVGVFVARVSTLLVLHLLRQLHSSSRPSACDS